MHISLSSIPFFFFTILPPTGSKKFHYIKIKVQSLDYPEMDRLETHSLRELTPIGYTNHGLAGAMSPIRSLTQCLLLSIIQLLIRMTILREPLEVVPLDQKIPINLNV